MWVLPRQPRGQRPFRYCNCSIVLGLLGLSWCTTPSIPLCFISRGDSHLTTHVCCLFGFSVCLSVCCHVTVFRRCSDPTCALFDPAAAQARVQIAAYSYDNGLNPYSGEWRVARSEKQTSEGRSRAMSSKKTSGALVAIWIVCVSSSIERFYMCLSIILLCSLRALWLTNISIVGAMLCYAMLCW